MKTLRQTSAAITLGLLLAASALAGQIGSGGVVSPPPPPSETSTSTMSAELMTTVIQMVFSLMR